LGFFELLFCISETVKCSANFENSAVLPFNLLKVNLGKIRQSRNDYMY